ncbi:MAG: class C sortase [Clostridia bacterium]|nr:class C sortase [Clostridia bacterium]
MKKHMHTIILVVIFLCGLSLFLYPTVSNLYNDWVNRQLIGDYQNSFADVAPETKNEALAAAESWRENRKDPERLAALGLTYENVLNVANNGVMGYIEIPKISVSLVIYHTIEENVLQRGIGHVPESDLPIGGQNTHCVLAGHTGLPSAKLLTNLDHMKVGDRFYIHVLDEVLSYEVDDVSVVLPEEISRLNVVSGKDCVTLVTCTPYGVNSHRLLVRGVRITDKDNLHSKNDRVQNEILHVEMKYLLTFSLLGIAVLSLAGFKIVSLRKKRRAAAGKDNHASEIREN